MVGIYEIPLSIDPHKSRTLIMLMLALCITPTRTKAHPCMIWRMRQLLLMDATYEVVTRFYSVLSDTHLDLVLAACSLPLFNGITVKRRAYRAGLPCLSAE